MARSPASLRTRPGHCLPGPSGVESLGPCIGSLTAKNMPMERWRIGGRMTARPEVLRESSSGQSRWAEAVSICPSFIGPGTWVTLLLHCTVYSLRSVRPMPWLETDPMDQRLQFPTDYQRGLYSMTEPCARYSICRKTGYACLDRFEQHGRAWPRAAAPPTCALTGSRRTSRPCSVPPGASTRIGAPGNHWTTSSPSTRASRGPRSAP